MALPIVKFPIETLTPKHPAFWPFGGVRVGPSTLSQLQDFDSLDGGPMWRARLIDIPIYCRNRILLAQAIQSLALSGVGLFDVPRVVADRAPGFVPDAVRGVPHSDLTPFDDLTLYVGEGYPAGAAGAWSLTDSIVTITFGESPPDILGGEEFTVRVAGAGSRMHRIMRILEIDGAQATVEISPPLRSDVPAGAAVDFTEPSVVMRMTNPSEFLQALEWNRWADVTAEFEEAFF